MDESTNTLLYTATYVFIFVIATSLSIVLYLSVNRYADSAYEYKEGISGSIINSASTGIEEYETGKTPLTKDDVFSYFVNYVKKDLYGENGTINSGYVVDLTTLGIDENMSYSKAYSMLTKEKYYIEYVDENSGIKYVSIKALE